MRSFPVFFLVTLVTVSPIEAQLGDRVLPVGDYIPRLMADPREPRLSGKLLTVAEGATALGSGVEAEAGLGGLFPALLLFEDDQHRYLVVGMGAGVWGRFNMVSRQKELIASDWVFRLPVVLGLRDSRIQLSYIHTSAHLGDEYAIRFGLSRSAFSRDQIDLQYFHAPVPGLRLNVGGAVAINVEPDNTRRLSLRAGAETAGQRVGAVQPYAGVDIALDQDADWKPRLNAQMGLDLLPDSPRKIRFAFEFLLGPSPMAEFHRNVEKYISLGVYVGLL